MCVRLDSGATKKQPDRPNEQGPGSIGKDIQAADRAAWNEGLMEFVSNPIQQTPYDGHRHDTTRPCLTRPVTERPDKSCGKQSIDRHMGDLINSRQGR